MKLAHFLLKRFIKREKIADKFADFFLHTSEHEKKEVFKEAARRANQDQRAIFEQHT